MRKISDLAIIIGLDGWIVVYYKGKMYAEGHSLQNEDWIKFGMMLEKDSYLIEDIIIVSIDDCDVSDERILWNFPIDVNELNVEIKAIINKAL